MLSFKSLPLEGAFLIHLKQIKIWYAHHICRKRKNYNKQEKKAGF